MNAAEFARLCELADAWGAGWGGDDPTGLDLDAYADGLTAARELDQ